MRSRDPVPPSQWSDPRHRAGWRAEQAAIGALVRRGWAIVAHRFRVGHSDLDLIARRGSEVAFVEVKGRGGSGLGAALEAVGWQKRRTLARLAGVWLARHGRPDDRCSFAVVAVTWGGSANGEVTVVEDAWRPDR
jgi:putative endonuclease